MSGETENQAQEPGEQAEATPPKVLSPAAQRALAEAEERRRAADAARAAAPPAPREINGPKGLELGAEPTRYGDWEVKGIVSDF